MYIRFSDLARRVILVAQNAASARGSLEVGPGHLLLGLLATPEGGGRFLLERGIKEAAWSDQLPPAIIALSPPLAPSTPPPIPQPSDQVSPSAPQSSRSEAFLSVSSKQLLHDTATESRHLRAKSIGSHHLLLALLRMRDEPALHWLVARDITYEAIREVIVQSGYNEPPPANFHAPDSPDFKLNLMYFLVPVVCWTPLPTLMAVAQSHKLERAILPVVLTLFAVPLVGAVRVIGTLLFSRSERAKIAGLMLMIGLMAGAILFSLTSQLIKIL